MALECQYHQILAIIPWHKDSSAISSNLCWVRCMVLLKDGFVMTENYKQLIHFYKCTQMATESCFLSALSWNSLLQSTWYSSYPCINSHCFLLLTLAALFFQFLGCNLDLAVHASLVLKAMPHIFVSLADCFWLLMLINIVTNKETKNKKWGF